MHLLELVAVGAGALLLAALVRRAPLFWVVRHQASLGSSVATPSELTRARRTVSAKMSVML